MADAYKCDRCKKLFEGQHAGAVTIFCRRPPRNMGFAYDEDDDQLKILRMDELCNECITEFNKVAAFERLGVRL